MTDRNRRFENKVVVITGAGSGIGRTAALAFAREIERRAPDDVTTTWWRKDRDPEAVFVDYNQNARDHTIAAAYSVRGNDIGTVSTPIPEPPPVTSATRVASGFGVGLRRSFASSSSQYSMRNFSASSIGA